VPKKTINKKKVIEKEHFVLLEFLVYIFPFFKPQVALCAAARAMNTTTVRPKNGVTLRNW
jgi:hypothetical protein